MNDPNTSKPDVSPAPERDTSREGREEEVINQQEANDITNSESNTVVNNPSSSYQNTGEQQFMEGTFDHSVRLDDEQEEKKQGSDRTGNDEASLPGSGI